jgi:hypothetical protein
MTNYSKRIFEMLVRVLVFRSSYQDLIGKDSHADQLLQTVDAALKKISAHSTLQASERNAVRRSSTERTSARDDLRKLLESVSRTAASVGLKEFFMPRDKGDRAIADVGRIFAKMAEPLRKEFIANHMPADFIDRLKAGVQGIERSIEQQAASKGARKAATTAIATAQAEALAALTRLDPIMDNLLRDNQPVKSVWDAARRVEKAPASKKPAEKEETLRQSPLPSSLPPVSTAGATPA